MDGSSLNEFLTRFPTEEACINYLIQLKWPHGFHCPHCDHRQAYSINTRRLPLYECTSCHHQTSLTVGTVMEGSKTELRKWLTALFLVSRITPGISALELCRKISVTYKTAWLILHKIRQAMSEADASVKLGGMVHVNEVWYGHTRHTSSMRHPLEYPLLLGASMLDLDTPTYVKIKLVTEQFIQDRGISRRGRDAFTQQHVETDALHTEFVMGRVRAVKYKKLYPLYKQLNQWIRSTFYGIGPRHLNAYLQEFCYRINHQDIFDQLVPLCLRSRPISYVTLTS
jgi:transposase-like protein